MKKIFQLFLIFLKIGALTFGGGLAMIPFIEKEVVEKKKWITSDELLEIITIAQSTPGAIALNTATYVGAKVKGFWGALVASIGVMLPSFIIIILISPLLIKYREVKIIMYALIGIRSAVVVLILDAVIRLFKKSVKSIYLFSIMTIATIVSLLDAFDVIKFSVIYILLIVALIGIIKQYAYDDLKARKNK